MKQVWMLNHYAQEPGGPGGTRHYSLAFHLAQHDWETSIIGASVEYNTGRQRLEQNEFNRVEIIDSVRFDWIRTPPYKGNGINRMVNMLAYTLRVLYPKATRDLPDPDVIIGSSVHPFAAWAGARLAKRLKVPFLFEVRDLWPQTLIDMGRLKPSGIRTSILKALEKWLYRRADKIIVLLPRAMDYLSPLGIPEDKVVWVPNGVELSDYPCPPPPDSKEEFTLMYFGAHGGANGLDNLLKTMKILEDKPIKLRLIGDGPLKETLQADARHLGLKNVSFEDPIAKSEIRQVASEADAFVFNLVDAPVFKFGISSNKLFDFMAANRPVLFCCESSNNPIAESGGGLSIPPGDPEALAQAVNDLISRSVEERQQMGQSARKFVEDNHGFDRLAEKLAGTLNEFAGD